MTTQGETPNAEQESTLQGLREDYGVASFVVDGGWVEVVDGAGDRWQIKPDGEPTCLPPVSE